MSKAVPSALLGQVARAAGISNPRITASKPVRSLIDHNPIVRGSPRPDPAHDIDGYFFHDPAHRNSNHQELQTIIS